MFNDENIKNIQLIYEFNNNSPLFARVAEAELKKENFNDAELILKKGIEKFPNYATPYFICALSLAQQKKFQEAEIFLLQGHSLFGDELTFQYYSGIINKLQTELNETEQNRNVEMFSETDADEKPDIIEEVEANPTQTPEIKEVNDETKNKQPIEERLDELAEQLNNAQISLPFDKINEKLSTQEFNSVAEKEDFINLKEDEFDIEEVGVASETLAMILESQQELKSAIKVYKKLIDKEPEKADAYRLKIKELENKLSSQNK